MGAIQSELTLGEALDSSDVKGISRQDALAIRRTFRQPPFEEVGEGSLIVGLREIGGD